MFRFIEGKHYYKWVLLSFMIILIQTYGSIYSPYLNNSNFTSTKGTPVTTTTNNCFYGIDVTNVSQLVEVCLNVSSSQMSFSTTKSDVPSAQDLDQIWMLITAAMVFLMQCGLSMFEIGTIQEKNIQSVVYKNLLNVCVTTIGYYLFGFCLSYGKLHSSNPFLGVGDTVILSHHYERWFYEWAFATLATAIASCAFAERATFITYIINSLCMVWWIYPIIVHWLWSETGWLSPFFVYTGKHSHVHGGALDFAGSCVVFIVAGWAGLAGAIILGPRANRFEDNNNDNQAKIYKYGRDASLQIIGSLIMWFGFYGFTCGRTLAANNFMLIASKIAVNVTLSASMGAITVLPVDRIINFLKREKEDWKISTLCNGVLVGLVSISSSCAMVDPWMAIIIGCVGGFLYVFFNQIELLARVDDPLSIWPTFGIGGFWAMIAVGFFGYHEEALRLAGYDEKVYKLGYGMIWGRQLLGSSIVAAWAFLLGCLVFAILWVFKWHRVDSVVEDNGLDSEFHDEKNYGSSIRSLIEHHFSN